MEFQIVSISILEEISLATVDELQQVSQLVLQGKQQQASIMGNRSNSQWTHCKALRSNITGLEETQALQRFWSFHHFVQNLKEVANDLSQILTAVTFL